MITRTETHKITTNYRNVCKIDRKVAHGFTQDTKSHMLERQKFSIRIEGGMFKGTLKCPKCMIARSKQVKTLTHI